MFDQIRGGMFRALRLAFNNDNELGEYIFALSNAAHIRYKYDFLVCLIDDKNHEIVGTDFYFDKSASHGSYLNNTLRDNYPETLKLSHID